MIEAMRKHHKVFLLVTGFIVVVSMIYWGQDSQTAAARSGAVEINGKRYYQVDRDSAALEMDVARRFGGFGGTGPLSNLAMVSMLFQGQQRDPSNPEPLAAYQHLVNLVTIRDQAAALGLAVTEDEVKAAIQELDAFKEGSPGSPGAPNPDRPFSKKLYDEKITNGAVEKALYAAVKDGLLLNKMVETIGIGLPGSEVMVNDAYNRQNSNTTAHAIFVPKKDFQNVTPTEEDAKKFYDAKSANTKPEDLPAELATPATRDIEYVKFAYVDRTAIEQMPIDTTDPKKTEADTAAKNAKLEEAKAADKKARITAVDLDALLSDEPSSLAEAVNKLLARPDAATRYAPMEVKTATGISTAYTPDDLKGISDADIVAQIFKEDQRTVNLRKGGQDKGYLIYRVIKKGEPTLLPFDQAKAKILEKLTEEKVTEGLNNKVTEIRSNIQKALDEKKSVKEAMAAAGVPSQEFTWGPKKQPPNPPVWFSNVQSLAAELNPGEMSKDSPNLVAGAAQDPPKEGETPQPDAKPELKDPGKLIVVLEKQELPNDPKMADEKKRMLKSYGSQPGLGYGNGVFHTWFKSKREEAEGVFKRID